MQSANKTTSSSTCKIMGIGAWGPGFNHWQDLLKIFAGNAEEVTQGKGPKPEIIPANERRRAPLPVRLAVETSWQSLHRGPEQTQIVDPKDTACVFASGLGDTEITDYMCRALNTELKQMSPTKFHNSVHNAAAGYWTISTGCMKSANSIAGGLDYSVPLTLLEGINQATVDNEPMILTFYDTPTSEVLRDLYGNDCAFGASILIVPEGYDLGDASLPCIADISVAIEKQGTSWPALNNAALTPMYEVNPAAKSLLILEHLQSDEPMSEFTLPLSNKTQLRCRLVKAK